MMNKPSVVPGFRLSGVACGIKPDGALDLALVIADSPCAMAAVYTQNRVQAAPVEISRAHRAGGLAQAILVNSGNANACTGQAGFDACMLGISTLAQKLGCPESMIQVASTGVIGVPLPIAPLLEGLPAAVAAAGRQQQQVDDFSKAICTTDRFPKGAAVCVDGYSISVFAKGAGMIAPNMATMLAYALTDAPVHGADLQALWKRCVDSSFNAVMVDGDTSTNDTAVLLAGGQGEALSGKALERFEAALREACQQSAVQIVEDGEGARCVVEITVSGAPNDDAAQRVARTIALSPLCKTAFFGADPNWGRIVAAAGRAGVEFDAQKIRLSLSGDDQVIALFDQGVPLGFDKAQAQILMRNKRFAFHLELRTGSSEARIWTCDLGHNYVTLNAEYTT
jgi:glutamate N-acetyltransferase/amino-acid N-acetyltransferase